MKKNATAIEITDTNIKLIQAQNDEEKGFVTFCDVQAIDSQNDEDIVKQLNNMVSLLPAKPKEIICLIPRQLVILRQMSFPTDNHDEIQDMIGLQLINKIPYSIDDIHYQHILLGQDSSGHEKVLVIIINKEVSQRYDRLLKMTGFENGKLVLSSHGIAHWVAHHEKRYKITPCEPMAVINIDSKHCEICFCYDTKLIFSRYIAHGKNSLSTGKIDELLSQIHLSLEMYQNKHMGPIIKKILILSAHNEGEHLKKCLDKDLQLPIILLESIHDLPYLPNIDRAVIRAQEASSLTAGLGIMFSDINDLINLAPVESHKVKILKDQKQKIVRLICLLFTASLICVCGQVYDVNKKRTNLELLKKKHSSLQPQVDESLEKTQLVRYLDKQNSQSTFIPDLINELNHLTPKRISFRILSLDPNGKLMIQGYAQNNAQINNFRTQLIRSTWFREVDLKFAVKRIIANKSVMDFKIAFQLGSSKEDGL